MAYYFLANQPLKLLAVFSPKCASQTIGHWFLSSVDMEREWKWADVTPYQNDPADILRYGDYLKVLFVRDPLRRLVSFYMHWVVRDNRHWCFADQDRRFLLRRRSFRQFIHVLAHLSGHGLEFQHHLQPQVDNVSHVQFDRILLVEDLDNGLQDLNRELGLNSKISHFNRSEVKRGLRENVADRLPAWLRANGIPPAEWFYDSETFNDAALAYAQDIDFYRLAQGKLLTPRGNL